MHKFLSAILDLLVSVELAERQTFFLQAWKFDSTTEWMMCCGNVSVRHSFLV